MTQRRRQRRGHRSSTPQPSRGGFHGLGLDAFFQILLPKFAGPEKREFYNGLARGSVALAGMLGLVTGALMGGPVGALIGFGVSVMCASRTAVRGRFFRNRRF